MKFIDLGAQYEVLKDQIDSNISKVLEKGQYINGEEVEQFETELAEYIGRKHCISCANGTDALQIAYMLLGIGKGDAVFCPDITFISSTEPAMMLGATPVFCDIDRDNYCLSPQSLEKQILSVKKEGVLTPKVVIAVDILGNPCRFEEIISICQKYNLILIEDAAQSMGASYKGEKCGSFGKIACTSFFPAKPLGCYGDGGALFVDDDELNRIGRSICVHGKGPKGKYNNVRIGMNSRLDTIQAAILLPKLKALKEREVWERQQIAQRYNKAFSKKLITPFVEPDSISVYAQYAVLARNTQEREKILKHLSSKNIPTMVYYPTPQHELPVFKDLNTYDEKFENAIEYCARTFSLPMHPYLVNEEQDRIIESVLEVLDE